MNFTLKKKKSFFLISISYEPGSPKFREPSVNHGSPMTHAPFFLIFQADVKSA